MREKRERKVSHEAESFVRKSFHGLFSVNRNLIFTSSLSSSSSSSMASPSSRKKFSYRLPCVVSSFIFSVSLLLLYKVDRFLSQTGTVVGHNLEPPPWHIFPPKTFTEQSRYARASKIIQCSYLTCPYTRSSDSVSRNLLPRPSNSTAGSCPEVFRWIHRDLEPWARTRITMNHVMEAKNFAAFRVTIVDGILYVDFYYACVQSRAMFTIWGLLQLIKRYPGRVPDVDLMFDCMDRPTITRTEHGSMPLPLFRYCTTPEHFDIPFPDWSFWGWPETNLRTWDEEFRDIKQGSQSENWSKKIGRAFWRGNPDVVSPVREELMKCNHSRKWGAQIMRQDWVEEEKAGYEQSKLSNQCKHRYKIYAEGYAWSVSLKYIISCGSLTLIISPQYEDFFSRGLMPGENYWPVSAVNMCPSIKFAVDWGNSNPAEAEAIGKGGQKFMETLNMDRVYDYMFHLINEYAKLLDFKPTPPPSATQTCLESVLCYADAKEKSFLERSTGTNPVQDPCNLQDASSSGDILKSWIEQKANKIAVVREMEKKFGGV